MPRFWRSIMAELNQIIGTFPNRTIVMEEDRESHCQSHKSRHHSHIQQKQISPVSKGSTLNTAPNSIQLCSFFIILSVLFFIIFVILMDLFPKKQQNFPFWRLLLKNFPTWYSVSSLGSFLPFRKFFS